MTKTVTRSDLRTAVRNRGEFLEPYFTDTEINNYINQSLAHLYDLIIASDMSYFLTQSDINITSGTRSYSLPSNFYKCVGVALYDSSTVDGYSVLQSFNFEERWDSITLVDDKDTRYEIRGDNIIFHPTPTFTKTAILEYIPTPTELTDDVTTWDSINLWTEWVIMDVLIACAGKEESDPSVWVNQKNELEKRIFASGKRDLGQSKTIGTSNNLRDLRYNIRNRGNWPREVISDNQLTVWINSSINNFVDLVSKHDPSYYLSYHDITLVSGQNSYSLPTDFYKLQGVAHKNTNADGYSVMEKYNYEERYDYDSSTDSNYLTRYNVMGSYIYFQPTPASSGTVRLEYIPIPTALEDATDTFDFYNGWQEWVILDVCVKVCALLNTDPSIYLNELMKTENRIISNSARDVGKPKTVTSVYRDTTRSFYPGTYWRR